MSSRTSVWGRAAPELNQFLFGNWRRSLSKVVRSGTGSSSRNTQAKCAGIPGKGGIHPKFKTSWEDKAPRPSRAEMAAPGCRDGGEIREWTSPELG